MTTGAVGIGVTTHGHFNLMPTIQDSLINKRSAPNTKLAGRLQDLLDPAIVNRAMVAPWGRDKQGVGQWAVPGIVAGAMKAIDQTGEAMRLPPNTSPDHPAYKGVFDVAGAINMPALLRKGATSTLGMNLYHGGPNKWAAEPGFPQGRPRLDKMGSGEGAQAYGHGFYSAEKRAVADDYNKKLTGMRLSSAKRQLDKSDGDVDAAILKANQEIKRLLSIPDEMLGGDTRMRDGQIRINEEKIQELSKLKQSGEFSEGSLYKIDIPDEDVAKYLDWDAPLSEQPENVRKALKKWGNFPDNMKGSAIYESMASALAKPPFDSARRSTSNPGPSQAASEALRKAGIPGLKYRDEMSRYDPDILPDNMIANEARKWLGQSGGDSKKAIKLFKDSNPRDLYAEKEINEIEKVISTAGRKITRNYVTWDQDVLDRAKVLQRNEEIYKQLEKSGVPFT